jgi:hypothetical protein
VKHWIWSSSNKRDGHKSRTGSTELEDHEGDAGGALKTSGAFNMLSTPRKDTPPAPPMAQQQDDNEGPISIIIPLLFYHRTDIFSPYVPVSPLSWWEPNMKLDHVHHNIRIGIRLLLAWRLPSGVCVSKSARLMCLLSKSAGDEALDIYHMSWSCELWHSRCMTKLHDGFSHAIP